MQRLALILAFGALIAAAVPAPGLYVALGLGIGAMGTGWIAFRTRTAPGFARLAGAAAFTLGMVGFLLGALRVVLALAAIRHLDRMLG
jgi:hypothetical protein